MSAPTRVPATFQGGSLDGKWTYLPQYELTTYRLGNEVYELVDTVWHSHEDDVMSHQVYRLVAGATHPQVQQGSKSKRGAR